MRYVEVDLTAVFMYLSQNKEQIEWDGGNNGNLTMR